MENIFSFIRLDVALQSSLYDGSFLQVHENTGTSDERA